ncbi:MFS transporter [Sporosarcina aquimarina]|uniref:MFS transporter n=1 Tax=Sporosarcina aquimarina TaxID=114975 RepID=UPI00203DD22C|nr:MFS transporter [Sporosarcina aquimarina]
MSDAKVIDKEEKVNLLRSRSFVVLLIATVVSSLSLSMFMFIQSWYVVAELNREASLGIIMICLTIPRMFSMIIGGVLADRNRQNRIMFFSDSSTAVLLLGLALLFMYFNEVPIWILAINAAFVGIFGGIFEPARDSILPKIVKTEQLTRANSMTQGAIQIALFSGPLLAGLLVSVISYHLLLLIISLLLCLSGIGVLFISTPNTQEKINEQPETTFINNLKEGFVYTWQEPLMRGIFIISVVSNLFISGPLMMGLPIFVRGVLDGDSLAFSLVQGGFTFGMIAGSVIIGIVNMKRKRGAYTLYLIALQGLGMLIFSQIQTVSIAVIVIIMIGILTPAINIPLVSMVQTYTDENKVGRVMSLIRTGSIGLVPLSYAITSSLLGLGITINVIMTWSSLPLIACAALLFILIPILRKTD